MSDFFNYTNPKAAKDHRCEWCGEAIPKGEVHVQGSGMWEGDWQNWRMHNECYEMGNLNDEIVEGFSPFENERPEKVVRESSI